MSLEPLEYLRHMLAEAEYLQAASAGLSREQFQNDATLSARSFEALRSLARPQRRSRVIFVRDIPTSSGVPWRACAIG